MVVVAYVSYQVAPVVLGRSLRQHGDLEAGAREAGDSRRPSVRAHLTADRLNDAVLDMIDGGGARDAARYTGGSPE